MLSKHHLQKQDLWWLIGYPLYQVLGTLRYECCHALAALAQEA